MTTRDAEILIVEDSPTQAEQLRALLVARGYVVRAERDGEAALAAMLERRPDLVVTDVVMPKMDGYTLCERIKSDPGLAEVPVILVTSLADPEDVIRSLQCGADNFIRKPYEDRYLLSRISNILTSRELRLEGRVQVGVEVYLAGERYFINAERQQILDFLLSTYEEVAQMNDELAAKNTQLQRHQLELNDALRQVAEQKERAEAFANVNRAVLDATADGIAMIDGRGSVFLRNAAFRRMLARFPTVSPERSLRENVSALAALAADADGFRAFVETLFSDPEWVGNHELELPSVGRWLHVFSAPVLDGSGERLGRIVVLRDVTAEREADRVRTEVVATISHELRTPLSAILGFAELLASTEVDVATQRSYLEVIQGEAERLTALVNDFLDLHALEQGPALIRERERVDLGEVVRTQAAVFASQSDAHRVAADFADEPLLVVGSRHRLSQVVANLLSNAIKYSPEGGIVDVTARTVDSLVEVRVQDEGMGIPEQHREKIFTKFFRVDSSDTRRIGGTGLGLALCREIVQAHDGEIGFDSAEGAGSTFWFRLPRADREDGAEKRDVPA